MKTRICALAWVAAAHMAAASATTAILIPLMELVKPSPPRESGRDPPRHSCKLDVTNLIDLCRDCAVRNGLPARPRRYDRKSVGQEGVGNDGSPANFGVAFTVTTRFSPFASSKLIETSQSGFANAPAGK